MKETIYRKAATAALNLIFASTEEISDESTEKAVNMVMQFPGIEGNIEKQLLIDELNKRLDSVPFKPRARLLLQLGDQLIRSESIALLELIKNAYDADANKVDILMENVDDPNQGIIIIEDDGFGMDLNTVINVWMEPGSDFKSEKFKKKEITPKFGRLPIGEKGIGRFGAHKLGNEIELITRKVNQKEVCVTIDWKSFETARYLEDVPVKILEREPELFTNGLTGTRITITNLRSKWTRGIARKVKRSVSSLTSPFESTDKFKVKFDILDKPGWFEGLVSWQDMKDYALFHFEATLEDNSIKSFNYDFTPWPNMTKLSSRSFKAEKEDSSLKSDSKIFHQNKQLKDEKEEGITLTGKNIGKVRLKGYIFDLDSKLLSLGNFENKSFKDYLKENGGVKVFRDGLRVYDYGEPGNDWLGLDIRRVNIPARRLSNNILISAIHLDREASSGLREKTNREGFIENDSFETLKTVILHTLSLVELFRLPDKNRLREVYGPTPKSEPVLSLLKETHDYIENQKIDPLIKKELNKYLNKIEADYKRINENLLKSASAGLSLSVVIHEVEKIIGTLIIQFEKQRISNETVELVRHLSSLIRGYAEILRTSTRTTESLGQIIDQVLFNVEFRLDSHQVKVLKLYKSKPEIKVNLAKSLILGCLTNLIDNSIYWLHKAGRDEKKVLIDIQQDEEGTHLLVADNGTGFTLPTDQIIEPFMSGKSGGMGLGLHIANEVMLAHKGSLNFPELGQFNIPSEFKNGAIVALTFK